MKFFQKIDLTDIGTIDLRPRKQIHADAFAAIIDRLEADRLAEKKREEYGREIMEDAVSSQAEIAALIKTYADARASLL
jgi:hypothetical protein